MDAPFRPPAALLWRDPNYDSYQELADREIQYCLRCLPQQRLARDGWSYTCDEFLAYYGPDRGGWEWHRSRVVVPPEHHLISGGHDVWVWSPETREAPDGQEWRCEDFLRIYGTERGAQEWSRSPIDECGHWCLVSFADLDDYWFRLDIRAPGVEYPPTPPFIADEEPVEPGERIYVTPGEASVAPVVSPDDSP